MWRVNRMDVQPLIKVCGVTRTPDVALAIAAGATAVGINLWPDSPRSVSFDVAETLVTSIADRCQTVAVVVDPDARLLNEVHQRLRPTWVQIHGENKDLQEALSFLHEVEQRYYFAVGLREARHVEIALRAPGSYVLVDARDDVLRGGTGLAPPSGLAAQVAAQRRTILAGGLGPANVAEAIRCVRPAGVDAASGLESSPGIKDPSKVEAFVAGALETFAALND
ncbi:MAG: phosphoribosylanthranilate isomerase [Myxococcota bacterium]